MESEVQQDQPGPGQPGQPAAEARRSIFRVLTWAAAALVVIGVLIMFIPGDHVIRLVSGFSAIAAGLVVLVMAVDMRRRFSRGA
jgi:drug/metabolite transporter (DMT)-like permease